MLQVQDAVRNSIELLGTILPKGDVRDPRLEEVSLSADEQFWLVTISFSNPDFEAKEASAEPADLASLLWKMNGPRRRTTRTVKLKSADGAFVGMKVQ